MEEVGITSATLARPQWMKKEHHLLLARSSVTFPRVVNEVCFLLLNGEAHPETSEHFRHLNPIISGGLLTTLHDTVCMWIHL